MLELLPEKEKKYLKRMYTLRFFSVILLFLLATLVFAGILLIPSYFAARSTHKSIEEQVSFLQAYSDKKRDDRSGLILLGLEEKMDNLRDSLTEPSFLDVVEKVTEVKPQNLSIKSLFFNAPEDEPGEIAASSIKVTLIGESGARSTLLLFVDRLKEISGFEKVDLPISNLAREKDIPYTITISVSK